MRSMKSSSWAGSALVGAPSRERHVSRVRPHKAKIEFPNLFLYTVHPRETKDVKLNILC